MFCCCSKVQVDDAASRYKDLTLFLGQVTENQWCLVPPIIFAMNWTNLPVLCLLEFGASMQL